MTIAIISFMIRERDYFVCVHFQNKKPENFHINKTTETGLCILLDVQFKPCTRFEGFLEGRSGGIDVTV